MTLLEMQFIMGSKEVYVTEKTWLAEKSFPVFVFVLPLVALYCAFLVIVPIDALNTKPPLMSVILGLLSAAVAWFVLVIVFSLLWTILMRLIYGASQVRNWLDGDKPVFAQFGNSLEQFMRKLCGIVLK